LPVIFFDGTRSMVHGPHTSSGAIGDT
jgi:hypothetical protein